MTRLVIDTSVAAKWFLIESDSTDALSVLQDGLHGNVRLHAPSFIRLELDSVLTKRVGTGHIFRAIAERIRTDFDRTPIQFHDVESLRNDAFQLAMETGQSVYDCLFLALAITLAADMVTADLRFKKGLRFRNLKDRVVGLTEYTRRP